MQFLNEKFSIFSTDVGIFVYYKLEQFSNADPPILFTPIGIFTEIKS